MRRLGIDGCKKGWFYVDIYGTNVDYGIVPSLDKLVNTVDEDDVLLVDIPIGLPDKNCPERFCDEDARGMLGAPRAFSVFPTPSRPALHADTYENACDINEAEIGKRLSRQSWAICSKIQEVDGLLQEQHELWGRIREIHPEVCFFGLSGSAMNHPKKKKQGAEERLEAIAQFWAPTRTFVEQATEEYRGKAARDDIIDALVGALCALNIENCRTLPDEPKTDSTGLTMEMVYWPAGLPSAE
jgi:predicted RNase H-like nuclease